MNLLFKVGVNLFALMGLLGFSAQPLLAQQEAQQVIQEVLAKPPSSTSSVLVLQFGATGMTDSAAKAYSNLIAQNLGNTNRFKVTNAEQAEQVVMKENPDLLPCFDIGCGIQMGKILRVDRILAGHISLDSRGQIKLNVKLVSVLDNQLEFEDSIRFTDESMDARFYNLSNRIARSTPLNGSVLEANNKVAVVSLGVKHGIRVGDQMIIFRKLPLQPRPGEIESKSRRKNIGILTMTKVGDFTSEGTYFQIIETPKPGQFVDTFLDKRMQISQVDEVRKELDTSQRHVYEIEKEVTIAPISLEDQDKKKWIFHVRYMEATRDYWQMWLMGSAVATGYFLLNFSEGDDLKLLLSMGALGYSGYNFFQSKNILKDLVEEGKFKGYLDLKIKPGETGMGLRITF